jgi:hypothetical protein
MCQPCGLNHPRLGPEGTALPICWVVLELLVMLRSPEGEGLTANPTMASVSLSVQGGLKGGL